jgi:hypothetical protein
LASWPWTRTRARPWRCSPRTCLTYHNRPQRLASRAFSVTFPGKSVLIRKKIALTREGGGGSRQGRLLKTLRLCFVY